MKEPFFAKSPPKVPSGSQQDGKEYTYFDSITRRYLERKRKNEIRRQQEEQQRQQYQLQKCTFRPQLTSQHYYQNIKQVHPKGKPSPASTYSNKKEEPYVRLLNWNHRRETEQRSKLIQRQLTVMVLRQSLSIEKRKSSPRQRKGEQQKMNRSLEETFRSQDSSEQHFGSINAVPVLSREEMEAGSHSHSHSSSYYQTFQSSKKNK